MVEYEMEPPRRNAAQTARFSVPPPISDVLEKLEHAVYGPQRSATFSLGQKTVVISDLNTDIDRFNQQLDALKRQLGSTWPCVSMKPAILLGDQNIARRWVPLDLELSREFNPAGAALAATKAGFDVRPVEFPNAAQGFFMSIADAIRTRLSASLGSFGKGSGQVPPPPATEVEVWATAHLQTVLFAKGYFVSTQQGFGLSNPAKRTLPHGQYLFGISRNGVADFDQTLWAVPQVTKVNLAKP